MAAIDTLTVSVTASGPGGIPLPTKTKYSIAALTAANFAAQNTAALALANRTQALVLGVVKNYSIATDVPIDSSYPASPANRGSKWIVTASNAAGQLFTYTIPTADEDGGVNGPLTNTDGYSANLASTGWTNYVGAFNAIATDRDGQALTFLRAHLGGRRA